MKCLIVSLFLIMLYTSTQAQQTMPLYSDSIPNSIAGKDEETTVDNKGIMTVSKVSRPTLTAYLPSAELANGTAIIVCPGGGYSILAAGHEGAEVAKELNKVGVAVFVLKYRIPSDIIMPNKEIGPLQDAQQAIKTVRTRAAEWNINPTKIGIMGFSAGGHLAASAGVHYSKALIENSTNISLRPDFLILIYPVISFQDSLTHMGSRNNLLGKNVSQQKKDYYSNELQVTDSTPTTFLVHATDDNAVKVENSIRFYQALVKHHVPAEIHIYEKGGHGFGTIKHNITTDTWMDRLEDWLKQRKLLTQIQDASK
jgi:acetyl esterase/lipase